MSLGTEGEHRDKREYAPYLQKKYSMLLLLRSKSTIFTVEDDDRDAEKIVVEVVAKVKTMAEKAFRCSKFRQVYLEALRVNAGWAE